MSVVVLLSFAVLLLAFSNGANDNFKGVATLFGSRTAPYRQALTWATVTTLAGSLASILLAQGLIRTFSGKGLVPDFLVTDPTFLLSVGAGAAATVILATWMGAPISTTHALTGALIGAGLASGESVNLRALGGSFFLPLLVSPFLSLGLTALLYPSLRQARSSVGVEREMCLCVGDGPAERVDVGPDGAGVVCATGVALSVGQLASCREEYRGRVFGFDAQRLLDRLHFFSAGMVGFARGLNDTPKMVALLAAGAGLGLTPVSAMLVVSGAMAAGGIVASRRVAGTMSERIVSMNHGQGFIANVVTAFLVVAASRFGVPVSTTHVSCGSLFGLGAVNGTARRGVIRAIVLAWVSTLPLAAVLAAAAVSAQGSGLATAVARMCSRA